MERSKKRWGAFVSARVAKGRNPDGSTPQELDGNWLRACWEKGKLVGIEVWWGGQMRAAASKQQTESASVHVLVRMCAGCVAGGKE